MLIQAIRIRGLRAAPELELDDLGATIEAPEGPQGVGLADALSMFSGSLRAKAFGATLEHLGLVDDPDDVELLSEGGQPVQAILPDPQPPRTLVADRRVTISLELALDPPLYGTLRSEAIKDPRLVTALGQDAVVGLKVGWLFSQDYSAISISLLEARIGDSGFPTGEPPTWLPGLLDEIGKRFHRVDWSEGVELLVERLFSAGLSASPDRRRAFERMRASLDAPPFELGSLSLVDTGRRELAFGPELLRLRQHGPGAVQALRLAEAAHLVTPDILVVEGVHGPARDWLVGFTTGDDATLEQVVFVDGGGAS